MPGTRVQVVLMTGLVSISRAAAAPAAGSWLMHSASRRRRLAVLPAFARAARFVSSLPMPRSRGWLMVVSVRSALP